MRIFFLRTNKRLETECGGKPSQLCFCRIINILQRQIIIYIERYFASCRRGRKGVAHDRSSFYQELSAPFFGANRPGSPATQGMRDLFWLQGLLGGAKAQYETTYSWELDYTADIAKCDKPLLVIHCEDDQIVPIGPTGRRVPSVVPHAILKVYEGGAHGIAIIDPERVNADFLAFIKGETKK
jgi:non-heme chloroperoxidase